MQHLKIARPESTPSRHIGAVEGRTTEQNSRFKIFSEQSNSLSFQLFNVASQPHPYRVKLPQAIWNCPVRREKSLEVQSAHRDYLLGVNITRNDFNIATNEWEYALNPLVSFHLCITWTLSLPAYSDSFSWYFSIPKVKMQFRSKKWFQWKQAMDCNSVGYWTPDT